jgi:hypothetical protein
LHAENCQQQGHCPKGAKSPSVPAHTSGACSVLVQQVYCPIEGLPSRLTSTTVLDRPGDCSAPQLHSLRPTLSHLDLSPHDSNRLSTVHCHTITRPANNTTARARHACMQCCPHCRLAQENAKLYKHPPLPRHPETSWRRAPPLTGPQQDVVQALVAGLQVALGSCLQHLVGALQDKEGQHASLAPFGGRQHTFADLQDWVHVFGKEQTVVQAPMRSQSSNPAPVHLQQLS